MATGLSTPTFNIKVVVRETGLKPDTLRAWERRYGIPSPQRTTGGHRLYSQQEINLLKWIIARQQEGLNISHAVELWNKLESEEQDPVKFYSDLTMPAHTQPTIKGSMLNELGDAWVEACLKFDEATAQHLLSQAFALFPIETVCFEILQKGLQQIGIGWHEGRVAVQQEHFASALALRQLEVLLASMSTGRRQGRLLIACPPMEYHTFSPLLLTLVLRRRGWDVIYLGANMPLEQLETSVRLIQPELVIMAAQTLYTAGTMLEIAQLLHKLELPLAFGGAVFNQLPAIRWRIPGYFLGTHLQEAPHLLEKLLQNLPALPPLPLIPSLYQTTLEHFLAQRSAIEAHVHEFARTETVTTFHLTHANENLGNNLAAALTLGDINLLWANLGWVRGLLVNYHYPMPADFIHHYLSIYTNAANLYLDQRGKPILDWLTKTLTNPSFH